MPTRRALIIAGVLTLFSALVILFPARVAFNWFAPPGINLGGIDGTVWSGTAHHMSIEGTYVSDIRWRAMPLKLITGKMAVAVSGKFASGFIETDVALGFGGDVYLTNLAGSLPVQSLQQSIGMTGLQGVLNVQFEYLRFSDGLPVAAKGTAEVSGLLLPLVSSMPIGGFRAEFFTQGDGIGASVEDTDGLVDLAGSLNIADDGNYQFLGLLAATPATPPQLQNQMRFLGSPNERGQYELRLEGQF